VLDATAERSWRLLDQWYERIVIVGLYQETPLNQPCRRMYPDHGFVWSNGEWIHEIDDGGIDPPWLEVFCLSDWTSNSSQI
jgi:hypothetical protein